MEASRIHFRPLSITRKGEFITKTKIQEKMTTLAKNYEYIMRNNSKIVTYRQGNQNTFTK